MSFISFISALPWLLPAFIFLPFPATAVWTQEPIVLREAFPSGYQYRVNSRVELSGQMLLPPEKEQEAAKTLAITGTSAIDYDERILTSGTNNEAQKTIRIYRRIDFQRKVGDRPQENTIRPGVRRLVILRHKYKEVPFSPDGPLTWSEIDLVRTDVFSPALSGLFPDKPVRLGERWTAADAAIQELTDLERIEEGQVECHFEQVETLNNRRHARIAFSGTVRGINEDGPNRQELDGYCFFDLESNHLSYLSLHGISSLLTKGGKAAGRIEGRFVLTRQVHAQVHDLSDETLKGVTLEPNDDNTRLLYDNPELGVRFLHSRRWRVARVQGRQVTLDEANGNGLLITLEPLERVPAGDQFLAESRDYLQKQKAKILRVLQPRSVQAALQPLEHFAVDAEIDSQRVYLDYYIVRQPGGGATLAARLLPKDLTSLQKEVEQLARSIALSRPR
jgi:hypothetical protein